MSSQSTQSVDEVRRRLLGDARQLASAARNSAWWRGVLIWLSISLATLVGLMLIDCLVRREELGLRLISLGALLAVMGFAAKAILGPVWRFAPTPLDMARWIEQQRPDLEGRLSTAIEIAETKTDDTKYGSPHLRDAVLTAWGAEGRAPDWRSYLDTSRLWRAASLLALIACVACIGWLSWPQDASLALLRLAMPWSAPTWPRMDQLEFVELPQVAGVNSELQLEIIDGRPPLPDDIVLWMRAVDDESSQPIRIPATRLGDIAIANVPLLQDDVEVRAVGGDDDTMPWKRIKVITPASLLEYYFDIQAPAYTQSPPTQIVGNRIQVLSGSSVRFAGRWSEPIEQITAQVDRGDSAWDVELGEDQRSIELGGPSGRILTESLRWRFGLTTQGGLKIDQSETWSIDVIEDEPPQVALDSPNLNRITANAELQILGRALDDLGLASVRVATRVESDGEAEPFLNELWSQADQRVTSIEVNRLFDISRELGSTGSSGASNSNTPPLGVGQSIVVWLEATDILGQVSKSQPERFQIESDEEVLSEVLSRQNALLKDLRSLVESQRRSADLSSQATDRMAETETISQQDVDGLKGVEELQSAIASNLSDGSDSLAAAAETLENILKQNRLEASTIAEQIRFLGEQIQSIGKDEMQRAVEAAASAANAVDDRLAANLPTDDILLDQVRNASETQSEALDALQALADRIDISGGLQQVQQDFTKLANEQDAIREDTRALQLAALDGLTDEQVVAAKRELSSAQAGLAGRLDELVSRSRELSDTAPSENKALADDLMKATEDLIAGQASRMMRQASEQLAAREFTAAAEKQSDVSDILSQALQNLKSNNSSARSGALADQAKQMQGVSQDISKLASEQQQLSEAMRKTGSEQRSDELAGQQSALTEQSRRQAEQAAEIGDRLTSQAIQDASPEQERSQALAKDQEMQQAADAAAEASQQLEAAAEQIEQRADELLRQAQQQQLYKLANSLDGLAKQQAPILEQLQGLAQSELTAELEQQARIVSAEQESLRQKLQQVQRLADQLPTFSWTLQQAEIDMSRSAAAAQRFRIDPDAITAAKDALTKLELALSAIEQSPAPEDSPNANQEQPEQASAAPEDGPTRAMPPLASLKLLRGLQAELNTQTQSLQSETNGVRRNQRLSELSQQQLDLGSRLEELLQQIEAPAPPSNRP